MIRQLLLALMGVCAVLAQAPNTVAKKYPNLRTASQNTTVFIIPVDRQAVEDAVKPYPLLPVPVNNKKLFPNGFPADKHPVMIVSALQWDIRMSALFIQALGGGAIRIPYVDRTGDGKTAFQMNTVQYVTGYDGDDFGGVVPAIASTLLFGYTIRAGLSTPDDAAYADLGNGIFSTQVRGDVFPNPISGPGVEVAAMDLLFHSEKKATYPVKTFKKLLNQPSIQNTGLCQRNRLFYNEPFANPTLRKGRVTLYEGLIGEGQFAGVYDDVPGLSIVAENVGFTPQTCDSI